MSNNTRLGNKYAKLGAQLAGARIRDAIIDSHKAAPIGGEAFERRRGAHRRTPAVMTDAEIDAKLAQVDTE